jgi:hypothetical protein
VRRLLIASVAVAAGLLAAGSPLSAAPEATFRGSVAPLSKELRERMTGISWHRGCPVPLRDLRLVTVRHHGFDGRVRTGVLVVHEDVAGGVVKVFRRLFEAGFPIRRMRLVDEYGGSDFRSIEADNTSAFNCRRATGSGSWSNHAYGKAIDLKPIENPYVENGRVYHDASRRYVDRSKRRKGMVHRGGVVVRAFASIGWGWGGNWSGSVKDYQHFSWNGR